MLLPNKLFSYSESVLSKLPTILKVLKKEPLGVQELYKKTEKEFSGVNEYIDALDCLYALHKIEYDDGEGVLRYVI